MKDAGALSPASYKCLSVWVQCGKSDTLHCRSFIPDPPSGSRALLFAPQFCSNSLGLEGKLNFGCQMYRLASTAAGKLPLFTQHKACGGCGATERLWNYIFWMLQDELTQPESEHLCNGPHSENKGYRIQNSAPNHLMG